MTKPLVFFLFVISFALHAQIPLTISEFDFEDTPLINLAVGDLDDNGKPDIYVIGEGEQQIFRLTNLGNGTNFIKTPYYQLNAQPRSMGTISWNGGDDMYYTLEGEQGIFTLYGKDPLINEKKSGAVILDTVGGLNQADLKPLGPPSQILMSSDTAGDLHFLQIIFGSFNYIFPQISSQLPMAGDPGQISSLVYGDTVVFFVPSINAGEVLTGQVVFNDMDGKAIFEDQLDVFDNGLQHPLASMTYADTMGNRMMFVLDTGLQEIVKYVFQEGMFSRTTLDASFTQPTKMTLGYLDGDDHPDLIVADGPTLWLLSNAPSRSGVQAEMIVTYDEPIADFVLTDFDGDGIDDIASIPVSRDKVLVARNDLMTATHEVAVEPFGYWPNPVSSVLYFKADVAPQDVKLISDTGQIYSVDIQAGQLMLEHIPDGIYVIQTMVDRTMYIDKVSILSRK